MSSKNEFLFDKRIIQRNVDKGLLDAKAADKALAYLPDRADNVANSSYHDADDATDDISDDEE